jgi:uncharacterized protein
MLPLIAKHKSEIAGLCRRYHVRRLDLFGSAARGDFNAGSDVDFVVQFDPAHAEAFAFKTYLQLREALEALLGRPVDLVELSAVRNPYLSASIERARETIFEA